MRTAVKNASRGWWLWFVLSLGVPFVLPIVSPAQANPASTTNCTPGRPCKAKSFTATSGAVGNIGVQVPNLDFVYFGNSCGIRANGSSLNVGSDNACSVNFASGSSITSSALTTGSSVGVVLGSGASLQLTGHATPAALPTPSTVQGLALDAIGKRLWKSNASEWTEVGDAISPARWRTYIIESDRTTGANAATWLLGPRQGGASVAFTSAGTLSNRTGPYSEALTAYATTAVSGNQAHHSTAAFHAPGGYVSFRVGVPTLTSVRVFYGMSNTLPLTSGSSTPTAHAAVFRYDTAAGDVNWMACTGAGVAITCTSTGVAVTNPADLDTTLEIDCREASALGLPTACVFRVNGGSGTRITTNLPAAGVGNTASTETLTAASRSLQFGARVMVVK